MFFFVSNDKKPYCMDKFYKKTLYELELAINELEIETDCPIQRIEAVIVIIVSSLSKLKEFVLKRDFINIDEEIRFFKLYPYTLRGKF